MSLDPNIRARIEGHLDSDRVVLFMKGTPQSPMCGFSARVAGILDSLLPSYAAVNVLEDQDIREGIKEYGQWPTIPQLYVDRELIGGCDIVAAMYDAGQLHELFGLEAPDRTPPEITLTEAAAEEIRKAMAGHEGLALMVHVNAAWQPQVTLARPEGHEIATASRGIDILTDLQSAPRLKGATIDWVDDSLQGSGLRIDLPEAPPPVAEIAPRTLKERLDAGEEILVLDVRPAQERERASLDFATVLDATFAERLETLPKDQPLVVVCHHGDRSAAAAEHLRRQGFTDVANLAGGVEAWASEVDPDLERY